MSKITRCLSTALALVVCAALSGGCTKSARRNRAISSGDAYYQAGELDKAELAYQNAARLVQPPSPIALRQLGLLYADEGRLPDAYHWLMETAKNEPGNGEVQVKLAAVCQELGASAQAREAALQALKILPGNEQALMVLGGTAQTPQAIEQARQYVEKLRQQDKDRASYHTVLGVLAARSQNLAGAEAEINKALAMDPKSSLAYLALADIHLARTNTAKAAEAFKSAMQVAPVRSVAPLLYARFLVDTGAPEQGRKVLEEVSTKAPDYMPALVMLMKMALSDKRYDECNNYITRILTREPRNLEALMEKGDVDLAKGEYTKAAADFEHINALSPKNPAPQVQFQLAQAHLLAGNKNQAIADLKYTIRLATNYVPAKLQLTELEIRQGDAASAVTLLTELVKQPLPDAYKSSAYLHLAKAYLALNDPGQAAATYRTVAQLYPKDPQMSWLLGATLLGQGLWQESRQAFERSLELDPGYMIAVQELVDLDLRDGHPDAALARVKTQIDRNPKAALPRLLQARVYLLSRDHTNAETALQKAIELDPKLPTPYLMLARIYVESKEYPQALERLNALIDKTNSLAALMQIGEIHDVLQEFDPARDTYEKLLKVDPQFGNALNNLAYLYSEHYKQLDKAYELALKDREISPRNPFVADTLGWILYKKGELPRALALLQESADAQPSDPEVHYHLAMAHYMMGEEDPARVALQLAVSKGDFTLKPDAQHRLATLNIDPKTATPAARADLEEQLKTTPTDPIVLARLAQIQERDGDMEKAAANYETIVKSNPQDVRAMARLAQLYARGLNQLQKGLALAKQANKASPDDPFVDAVLGRLEFQAHDYAFALGLLQDAARQISNQPDLVHDLAWCYFSVGKVSQAQATMQKVVQSGVAFPGLDDAKRFLGMVTACSSPAQAQAAATEVAQVLKENATYGPALMAEGLVQEYLGHPKEAEQIYTNLLAAYPLFAPAARQAGILLYRDGDDAKANPLVENARLAFPDDLELAKVSAILAYRRNEFQHSSTMLALASQKNPADAEILYYLGMDYYQLKQTADCKKALNRAVTLGLVPKLDTEAKRILALLK